VYGWKADEEAAWLLVVPVSLFFVHPSRDNVSSLPPPPALLSLYLLQDFLIPGITLDRFYVLCLSTFSEEWNGAGLPHWHRLRLVLQNAITPVTLALFLVTGQTSCLRASMMKMQSNHMIKCLLIKPDRAAHHHRINQVLHVLFLCSTQTQTIKTEFWHKYMISLSSQGDSDTIGGCFCWEQQLCSS